MIASPDLLRRLPNRRWSLIFLVFFLVQVLLITLVFQIELKNLIKFDKRFRVQKSNESYQDSLVDGHHQSKVHLKDPASAYSQWSDNESSNEEIPGLSNKESSKEPPDEESSKEESPNDELFTEEFSNCEANDPYLVSAIERARTGLCKATIKRLFCLHQENQLYPTELVSHSKCPNGVFKHVGCFLNNRRPSIIESLVFQYRKANELKCSYLCTQMNAEYFGIENATLCHCLSKPPPRQLAIDPELCSTYCDTRTRSVRCGGEYLISVYETGTGSQMEEDESTSSTIVEDDRADSKKVDGRKDSKKVEDSRTDSKANKSNEATQEASTKKEIRIAFILSVNGRSTRQIKRLIRLLYDRKHIYLIHVDSRNDFLFNSLTAELHSVPNLIITEQRFATIWGGSQLLTMLLASFRSLSGHEWDYVINLSESDFPIKPLASLERYLSRHEGKNFLKFHGQPNDAFVRKQGLEVLFLQCENRMWRLNKQRDLPTVPFSGGSDWIALYRSFVRWLVDDPAENSDSDAPERSFVTALTQFFNYTLLPAESYFHTALQNSRFCHSVINNNLRLTNWKRKIGCRCQYQHIVDWCGCSPNVYLGQDWPRLASTHDKPLFFARKFDPLIDLAIINQVEQSVIGVEEAVIRAEETSIEEDITIGEETTISLSSSYHRYWQNEFHFEHDRPVDDRRQSDGGDRLQLWRSVFRLLSTAALRELAFPNCSSNYASLCRTSPCQASPHRASPYQASNLDAAVHLSSVSTLISRGKYAGSVAEVSLNWLPDRSALDAPLKLDFLVSPNQAHFKRYNDIESGAFKKLVSLRVCTDYDVKEDLFRNFGCLMNGQVPVVVQHRWQYRSDGLRNGRLRGDGIIHFVWLHSSEPITFQNEINLTESSSARNGHLRKDDDVVTFHFEAPIGRPIRAGDWRLLLVSDFRKTNSFDFSKARSSSRFEPNGIKQLGEDRKSTSTDQSCSAIDLGEILNDINFGEVQSRLVAETRFLIIDSSIDFSKDSSNDLSNREAKLKETKLEELRQFWTIEDVCLHDQEEAEKLLDASQSPIKSCLNTTWSPSLPDPKSECC